MPPPPEAWGPESLGKGLRGGGGGLGTNTVTGFAPGVAPGAPARRQHRGPAGSAPGFAERMLGASSSAGEALRAGRRVLKEPCRPVGRATENTGCMVAGRRDGLSANVPLCALQAIGIPEGAPRHGPAERVAGAGAQRGAGAGLARGRGSWLTADGAWGGLAMSQRREAAAAAAPSDRWEG